MTEIPHRATRPRRRAFARRLAAAWVIAAVALASVTGRAGSWDHAHGGAANTG